MSFVGSCLLIETPRGISHCLLCLAATYAIHDLNPNPTNVTFCVLGLMVRCFAVEDVRSSVCEDTKAERYEDGKIGRKEGRKDGWKEE